MFGQNPYPAQGPWSGLPVAPMTSWGGGSTWNAAQQAPWRLSPWQTQGMPTGQPAPAPGPLPSIANPYMPLGGSAGTGINMLTPGGGFYPMGPPAPPPSAPAAGPAAPAGGGWAAGGTGQLYNTYRQAANATDLEASMGFGPVRAGAPAISSLAQQVLQGGLSPAGYIAAVRRRHQPTMAELSRGLLG